MEKMRAQLHVPGEVLIGEKKQTSKKDLGARIPLRAVAWYLPAKFEGQWPAGGVCAAERRPATTPGCVHWHVSEDVRKSRGKVAGLQLSGKNPIQGDCLAGHGADSNRR